MRSKVNLVIVLLYIVLAFVVFKNVFFLQHLAGGDYTDLGQERSLALSQFPFSAWQSFFSLGQSYVPFLSYAPYSALIGLFRYVIPNTVLLERVVWWIPYFLIGSISIWRLFDHIFPKNRCIVLAPLIYLFNSYALIIIGGGQVSGIGLAYAFLPVVVFIFFRAVGREKLIILDVLLIAAALAVEAVFDVRIAYITVAALMLFLLLYSYLQSYLFSVRFVKQAIVVFIVPLILVGLLHMYWLLPTILYKQNPFSSLGPGYTTADAVKFLSFAKLENTLSLMHPNWPENIFGKTVFMRPEFLFLPILAFSSLVFITANSEKRKVNIFLLFFAMLGLLGAFLAKGANDPFGGVYVWLFEHVPGFILFRDPTKWYPFIAVAYAVLIPFAIGQMVEKLKQQRTVIIFPLLFVGLFLFTVRFALSRDIGGVLSNTMIYDTSYKQLNTFLVGQPDFFRTLWVPVHQRLGYASYTHPAINAEELFAEYDREHLYAMLGTERVHELLRSAGVKYIIVPDDTHKEIFLKDRSYNDEDFTRAVQTVAHIPWVTPVRNFGKIYLFQLDKYDDKFQIQGRTQNLDWVMHTPANYQISAENGTIDGLLVFSEAYSPYWRATIDGTVVHSKKMREPFNAFSIPKKVTKVTVDFEPQGAVYTGLVISCFTVIGLCLMITLTARRKKFL